ncbi:DUF3016 domain-containing protein [Marilutibacter chinensis]|uniref:DUF3016 domain-containing protein n=1 Tax=Marilutibacter chinensis TaxID=2912247 RepID=A0ABS9HV03_9GAMM|nr:DUF3016 domain-containing protein [Lysobacter chinensis]MCF7222002.1 DUF3016 domain-containing protein [Lysobacter chinensis]
MNLHTLFRTAAVTVLLLAGSQAAARTVTDPDRPRQLENGHPVSVSWDDPAGFTELRYSGNRWEAKQGNWVVELAEYLRERVGKALPAGQRVDIRITNIDRAGDYEPGRGMNADRIRVMRDIYPPRLWLSFTRYDADDRVIGQGEPRLADLGYLQRTSRHFNSDPLAHEKRLVDDWVAREFGRAGR